MIPCNTHPLIAALLQLVKMHKLIVLLIFVIGVAMPLPSSALFEEYKFINRKIILPVLKSEESERHAVIFDAGSTGNRVHVFCFDEDLDLLPIGDDLELSVKTTPGLSSYASDPQAAADSLLPLLNEAKSVVPDKVRSKTPVRLGATAGLRLLEGNAADQILQAVRDLLKDSSLQYEEDGVSILEGFQEGSYMWTRALILHMAINFLLEKLGKEYSETVGVVDLGGGSVQVAYAVSEEAASNAPEPPEGESPYVHKILVKDTSSNIYAHSYLNYGLFAARAKILKVSGNNSANPCILSGYDGIYSYGGEDYKASGYSSGSSLQGCRTTVLKALNVTQPCPYKKCTFGGVWNGGGGAGQKNLYVASLFYDKAYQVGFIDANETTVKSRPMDFKNAAKVACKTKFVDAQTTYPDVLDVAYICMDLVYQYTLLVDGFGIHPLKEITLASMINYHDSLVSAAWPLGYAIVAVLSVA